MPFGGATIVFVPGLRDHVEDHWQTHAARGIPGSITVEPLRADRLSRAARVAALDAALNAIAGEVVIAAHSAGCLMVAHWAATPTRKIRGALLVTPADVEHPLPTGYPAYGELEANGWLPIPRRRLPFPAIVVASRPISAETTPSRTAKVNTTKANSPAPQRMKAVSTEAARSSLVTRSAR